MKTPNTINETNMQDINSKVQDEQKRKVMQSEVTRLFMFSSCYPSEGESLLYMVCILRNLSKVQSVGCPQWLKWYWERWSACFQRGRGHRPLLSQLLVLMSLSSLQAFATPVAIWSRKRTVHKLSFLQSSLTVFDTAPNLCTKVMWLRSHLLEKCRVCLCATVYVSYVIFLWHMHLMFKQWFCIWQIKGCQCGMFLPEHQVNSQSGQSVWYTSKHPQGLQKQNYKYKNA